ncbi:hypothetical protein V8E36_001541 [Tilletia maclaganii]
MALVLPGDIVHSADFPLGSTASAESVLGPDVHIKLGPGILPERIAPSSSSSHAGASAAGPTVPTLIATRAGLLGHLPGSSKSSSTSAVSATAAAGGTGSERSSKRPKIEEGSAKGKKAGARQQQQQDGLWVEANTRRYTPAPSDTIIGQITARGPDFYTVSLQTSQPASLPVLSFEGATKRHRPNIRVGALVYARVVNAERHTDPELSCVNPVTGKADGLGELKVGEREVGCAMVFRVSLGLASSLLHPSHPLLPRLAAHFPFEFAIGHNGLLWARASQPSQLIALGQILERAEHVGYTWASTPDPSAKSLRVKKEEGDDDDDKELTSGAGMMDIDEGNEGGGGAGKRRKDKEDVADVLSTRAQDVARLRGALKPDEIKRIVGAFL